MLNGLLIDCSRLLERKEYYFRLLDFMAEWGMNCMVLHFSDDHGISVKLPGFSDLAAPHAFTPSEIKKLVSHAQNKRIEIIPELETFGHTRYITSNPKYAHLTAVRPKTEITFGAMNPLKPQTHKLMKRMLTEVCRLFPSKYIHLGCDEVNLSELCCNNPGLNEETVWSEYVNSMSAIVEELGRKPLIWGDMPAHKSTVANMTGKNIGVCWWNYDKNPSRRDLAKLKKSGFAEIFVCPSVGCMFNRFLPTASRLKNARHVVKLGNELRADGVINTIWATFRYMQGSMYYAIAYTAALANNGGKLNLRNFHKQFAKKTFSLNLSSELKLFLAGWAKMDMDYRIFKKIIDHNIKLNAEEIENIRQVNNMGNNILPLAKKIVPVKNPDIWRDMILAAQGAWVCSEWLLLSNSKSKNLSRKKNCNKLLRTLRKEYSVAWDETRYPEDPQKFSPRFPNETEHHLNIILKKMNYLTAQNI